jgi:hypothetical protein
MSGDPSPHLLRLPGTDWYPWRECGLRSAGLQAASVSSLSDPELQRQVEAVAGAGRPTDAYRQAFREAVQRSAEALRALIDHNGFREAIARQNPSILRTWMSRVQAGAGRR